MNQENKKRWVEALRSGTYEQGRLALRKDDRYCCLGVLCDLKEDVNWTKSYGAYKPFPDSISVDYLDERIRIWADLDAGSMFSLTDMNDNGYTFEEIANWIEENL